MLIFSYLLTLSHTPRVGILTCTERGWANLGNRLFNHSMREENMLANLGKSGSERLDSKNQPTVKTKKI